MASVALVSILCRDKVGLVSAVADFLFTAGINLRDTTFAVYGAGAEFSSVCELPEGTGVAEIERGLVTLRCKGRSRLYRIVPKAASDAMYAGDDSGLNAVPDTDIAEVVELRPPRESGRKGK